MAYSGRYHIINSKKYVGDPTKIFYRSLWERKFMVYCDNNDKIIEWGSEESGRPYLAPWDGKMHRDFNPITQGIRIKLFKSIAVRNLRKNIQSLLFSPLNRPPRR